MIITKDLMQKIESKDTKIVFASDKITAILELLKIMYQDRCRNGIYITSVNKIYNDPQWINDRERSGGNYIVDVHFQVSGIIYDKYEVITNAVVCQILDSKILLNNAICNIGILNPDASLQGLTVGATIPIIVFNSRAVYMKPKMVIQGLPFQNKLMSTDKESYTIILTKQDLDEIRYLIDIYDEEDAKLQELPSKKVTKVIELLGFSNTKKNAVELLKLPLDKLITIEKSPKSYDLCCQVNIAKESKQNDNELAMKNPTSALKGFINIAIKNIILIRNLVIDFDPTDKKNKYMWDIYSTD